MSLKSAVLIFIVILVSPSSACGPAILTTSGAIQGIIQDVLNKSVHVYLGIPYATPPVGDLRFKKPLPVQPWNVTLNATNFAPSCMQHLSPEDKSLFVQELRSEDCLYLNVWVPQQTQPEEITNVTLKSIMIWIHGGGFMAGSTAMDLYDGVILASHGNIIVVTVNYRLGPFGFLNINDEEAPGNMGMMDQLLALQWIKDNAEAFGGDPNEITLFGESAGSTSVALHLLSPLSEGLFKRGIMQSGCPITPKEEYGIKFVLSPKEGPAVADNLAQFAGCLKENQSVVTHARDIMACLREKDSMDLAEGSFQVDEMTFLPRYGDNFLPLKPVHAIENGQINRADVLAGTNSKEGAYSLQSYIPDVYNSTSRPNITIEEAKEHIRILHNGTTVPSPSDIADFYLNGVDEGDYEAILQGVVNSIFDPVMVCPTVYFAEAFSNISSSVYVYFFDHHPSNSKNPEWMSMAHFDDVQFVFGVPLRNTSMYTKEEQELSRSVMNKWIGFAKTGKPSVPESEPWPHYTIQDHFYLQLKPNNYTVGRGPHLDACNFWRQYFDTTDKSVQ